MSEPEKRDYAWFDNWVRRAKMRPVCKIFDDDAEILIADSGSPIEEGGKLFYRTAYALNRDGVKFGAYEQYDVLDFLRDGPRRGQEIRVNEAIAAARKVKRQLRNVDYWEWVHGQA